MEFTNLMPLIIRDYPKGALISAKEILYRNIHGIPNIQHFFSFNSVGQCGFIFWKCTPTPRPVPKVPEVPDMNLVFLFLLL